MKKVSKSIIALALTFVLVFAAVACQTKYSMQFETNGGSAVTAIDYKKGDTLTAPADPTKTDRVFLGWYEKEDLSGDKFDFSKPLEAKVKLYAKWGIEVTFDSREGTAVDKITVVEGSAIATMPLSTKAGWELTGWGTASTGASKVTFPYTPTKPITLHASWTGVENTMTLNLNGGTLAAGVSTSYVAITNEAVNLPTPTKVDRAFGGWYKDAALTQKVDITMPAGASNAYAKWYKVSSTQNVEINTAWTSSDAKKVTVYQDLATNDTVAVLNEGKGDWDHIIQTISLDEKYAKLRVVMEGPVGAPVLFKIERSDGQSSGNSEKEMVLQEGENTFDITFNVENLTEESFKLVIFPHVAKTSAAAGVLGSAFYFKSVTFVDRLVEETAETKVLLSFNTNGGTVATAQSLAVGSTLALPAVSKEGYTFGGWYVDAALTTKFTATTMPANATVLFAKWESATAVVLTLTDSSIVLKPIVAAADADIVLPTLHKYGYTFNGWFTAATEGEAFTATKMPEAATEIFAQWTPNASSTISFVMNNATSDTISDIVAPKGSTIASAPANPERTGYTFAGWYTEAAFENAFVFKRMPSTDVTLHARWIGAAVTVKYNVGLYGEAIDQFDSKIGEAFEVKIPTANAAAKNSNGIQTKFFEGWYSDANFTNRVASVVPATEVEGIVTLYARYVEAEGTVNSVSKMENFNLNGNYDSAVVEGALKLTEKNDKGEWDSLKISLPRKYSYSFIVIEITAPENIPVLFKLEGNTPNNYEYKVVGTGAKQTVMWNVNPAKVSGASEMLVFFDYEDTHAANRILTFHSDVQFWGAKTADTQNRSVVVINKNDGSDVSVILGSASVAQPTEPAKGGFTFDGWYIEDQKINFPYTPAAGTVVEITAKWIKNTPVNFILDPAAGGSLANGVVFAVAPRTATAELLPKPTNTNANYVFGGWYLDTAYTIPLGAQMPDAACTLYAKWSREVTDELVTQYTAGVEGNWTVSAAATGIKIEVTTAFDGGTWGNISKSITNNGYSKIVFKFIENNPANFRIQVEGADGEWVESNPKNTETTATRELAANHGANVVIKIDVRSGSAGDIGTSVNFTSILAYKNEVVSYATGIVAVDYTLDPAAGGSIAGGTTFNALPNSASSELPTPTNSNAGYIFDGWYLDTAYTTPVGEKLPGKTETLYAKWMQTDEITSQYTLGVNGNWTISAAETGIKVEVTTAFDSWDGLQLIINNNGYSKIVFKYVENNAANFRIQVEGADGEWVESSPKNTETEATRVIAANQGATIRITLDVRSGGSGAAGSSVIFNSILAYRSAPVTFATGIPT